MKGTNMEINNVIEIEKQLQDLSKWLSEKFKNVTQKIFTDEIKDRMKHFDDTEVVKILKEIDLCIKILKSPVYIGLLGRYSHGKTALVNSLFSIQDDFKLAEGEGIVTSKITRVEFADIPNPKCFEYYRGGSRSQIDISALQESIRGKKIEESSDIDYYHMQMPAKHNFSRLFENKLINLIDMPGLGGPYFKDTEQTKKYIEKLDMLLVVIKISEIEKASKVVDKYIDSMQAQQLPMIPVITFFDKWKVSDKYVKCKKEEDVVDKIRDQIDEYFPSLHRHITRIIAVSSTSGFQIDSLRQMILNFIEEPSFAIEKVQKENPQVFQKKVRELQQALDKLILITDKSLDLLKTNIETLLPLEGEFQNFSKGFEKNKVRLLKDGKIKISRVTRDIFTSVKDKANDIRYKKTYDEIIAATEKLKNEINKNAVKDLREEVDSTFIALQEKIEENLEKYIDKLELDSETKETLKKTAIDTIKDSRIDLDDIAYEPPDIRSDRLTDFSKTAVEVAFGMVKNPQYLIPLGLGLLLFFVGNKSILGMSIPLGVVGIILIIGTLVVGIMLDNSAKMKNFNNSKNNIIDKLINSFDRHKVEEVAYNKLSEATNNLLEIVAEGMSEDTSKYGKDLKIVKETSKEFKLKMENLKKYLSREIEKLEIA